MTSTTKVLNGLRIQIEGSIKDATKPDIIKFAHLLVRELVQCSLDCGAGIVIGIGKEPGARKIDDVPVSQVFFWTILESIQRQIDKLWSDWPTAAGAPLIIVTSEKSIDDIPSDRRALWDEVKKSDKVGISNILPGSRSAALIRQRQALYGDILAILGGGSGVEHLHQLYSRQKRTVIPFDLELGSSRADGLGGATRLARESKAAPEEFLILEESKRHLSGTLLTRIETVAGGASLESIAGGFKDILQQIKKPRAFYVRLLNGKHEKFSVVEKFFRDIVDGHIQNVGLSPLEMGSSKSEYAFMNVAIFESLHHSRVAVVDITGERPNCFIELGYALARGLKVIVTAEEGTQLPFDQNAIPCHFWNMSKSIVEEKEKFVKFWEIHINRPSIIEEPFS